MDQKKNPELNVNTALNPDISIQNVKDNQLYTSVEMNENSQGESVGELRAVEEGNEYFAAKEIGQQIENG
ncbi:hypothetical protein LCM10_13575 [Rossellomorea aquimaris]|uniref:hypothetical protein n=1 Tax=Rossellomorea aquimaris TaxID=189382 RepID=UPI001CD56704|nr:hypothetical protein [Rossellomorea aquimaris]MCA1056023.1 hypothetical protein [Rossellomorea aquimaris]